MTSSEHPLRGVRGETWFSWRTKPSLLVEMRFSPPASLFGGTGVFRMVAGSWQQHWEQRTGHLFKLSAGL